MSDIQITATLSLLACSCGAIYGKPVNATSTLCPCCAGRQLADLKTKLTVALANENTLRRRISHMRGSLTRARRRAHG